MRGDVSLLLSFLSFEVFAVSLEVVEDADEVDPATGRYWEDFWLRDRKRDAHILRNAGIQMKLVTEEQGRWKGDVVRMKRQQKGSRGEVKPSYIVYNVCCENN